MQFSEFPGWGNTDLQQDGCTPAQKAAAEPKCLIDIWDICQQNLTDVKLYCLSVDGLQPITSTEFYSESLAELVCEFGCKKDFVVDQQM